MFFKVFLIIFFTTFNAFASIVSFCGHVSGVNEKNKIVLNFNLDKDCIFYTIGKQDMSTQPRLTVDNENIDIGNVIWPDGKIKAEMIGDERYEHTIVDKAFSVQIPFNIKKSGVDGNFSINVDYQLCKGTQCKAENIIAKMENGELSLIGKDDQQEIEPVGGDDKKCKSCSFSLFLQILMAFLSGIILNFMPCVLPVLGIKIASLSYGDKSKAEIRFSAFMSLLGILVSFILFGLMASAIKLPFVNSYSPQMFGSMFQNRYFVLCLVIIVAIFIDIQRGKAVIDFNFNNKLTGGFYNFFGGIISTILATPCVAPILGLSLVFSSNSSFFVGMLIFLAIGLGFGLPYLIAMRYPDIYKKLPKTGKLSSFIKRLLDFLMFATFFWLLFIVTKQSGIHVALIVMIGIFIFSRFGWKMKHWIIKLLLFTAVVVPMFLVTDIAYENREIEDKVWQKFSDEALDKALSEEKIVILLGTADWCSWCHILEKTVLEREKFINFVQANQIVMLKFEVTDRKEDEVREFYKNQKEYGLPILKIYSGTNPDGRSIIGKSFSTDSIIKEIQTEIESTHQIIVK